MNAQTPRRTIDANVLMPLQEAIKLLPNVYPATVRDQLGVARYFASRSPSGSILIGRLEVTSGELGELFISDERLRPRVSPKGAALLLQLYAADAFELKDARLGKGGVEALERYAESSLSQLVPWRRSASPAKGGLEAAIGRPPDKSALQHGPTAYI
jgi:hypothetical protein